MSTKGKERAVYDEPEEGEEDGYEAEEGEAASQEEEGSGSKDRNAQLNGGEGSSNRSSKFHSSVQEPWYPKHVMERPRPPSKEEREAELAVLEAQAKAGANTNDPRAKARVKPRRTVDYFGPLTRWRLLRKTGCPPGALPIRPQINYIIDLLPPAAYGNNASTSYCTKYVHTSTNKIRTPVNVVKWTPEGRRVLTGSASGEFTLWNGLTFNFETILQAHDTAIRAAEWSHAGSWLVSCDSGGIIKYFQPNMNNVSLFNGHSEPIRDISFAPDDQRFVTGSDDGSVKIWDFERRELEKSLTGHGYDVRCVKWHPTKSLLVSGSKNNLIKFWDPRTGTDLRTLHDHKNTVQGLNWSPNGNMVASASRDQSIKVFDIRMMKEIQDFRGHAKEVCSVLWHPVHHNHLVSGGFDGSLLYWNLDSPTPVDKIEYAHEQQIWALDFHPLGHLLATGSNDYTTRWWSRGRPGINIANDRFHVGRDRARELGEGKDDDDEGEEDDFVGQLPGLPPGGGGGGMRQQQFQHQQQHFNAGAHSSATMHMPNFAPQGANGGGGGGGFSIPGLDPSARSSASGGIPGLAAAQQAFANARTGQPLPSQNELMPRHGGYQHQAGPGGAGRGRYPGRGRGNYQGQQGGGGGGGRFRPY